MTPAALAVELLRPRRARVAVVVGGHVLATAVALAGPPLLGDAVDRTIQGGGVTPQLLGFVAVVVIGAVVTGAVSALGSALTEEVLADLRGRVVDGVTGRPIGEVEQDGVADALTRATADVEAITDALRRGVPRLVVAALTVVGTGVALALVAPELAVAAVVGVVVAVPAVRWYARRCGSVYTAERAANAERIRTFHEGATTARLVRAHGRADVQRDTQEQADSTWVAAAMAGARIRIVARSGVGAGISAALATVVVVGAVAVGRGWTSVGAVTAAVLYVLRTVEPIELLVHELDELQTARAAAARVAATITPVAPMRRRHATPSRTPADPGLRCRGIRFAYRPGVDVLAGVDLDIAPGERVALVGPSGAGKSTLARILAGVHPPDAGTVEVGGVDLRQLDPVTLRRWIVVLEQEGRVFAGTVADNLRLVAPTATDDELRDALAASGADWVERLPRRLAQVVGSGGLALSPVQARQLALAQVVLADPAVVVLDEATAGFDAAAARRTGAGLAAALRGRTLVQVSHRLDTARGADRIVVVDGGRIVEAGHHDELAVGGGPYAALWRSWAAPTTAPTIP
jgi:ABC-type multidrug transport system fused ATPase/permease subunit